MNDETDIEWLCAKALWQAMTGFSPVFTFRDICSLGLHDAIQKKTAEMTAFLEMLIQDPKYQQILKAPEEWESSGLPQLFKSNTEEALRADFEVLVDGASLLFAHAVVDTIAWECCRISSLVAPSEWEVSVKNRTVTVDTLKGKDHSEILSSKIGDYIGKLERESLIKKVDTLHGKCWIADTITGYAFDRDRLAALDELRHDVAHKHGKPKGLPNGDEDLRFLQSTALHLVMCVLTKYKLRIPEQYVGKAARSG